MSSSERITLDEVLAAKEAARTYRAEHSPLRPSTTAAEKATLYALERAAIDAGAAYRRPARFVSELPTVDRPRLAGSYGAVNELPRESGEDFGGLS